MPVYFYSETYFLEESRGEALIFWHVFMVNKPVFNKHRPMIYKYNIDNKVSSQTKFRSIQIFVNLT